MQTQTKMKWTVQQWIYIYAQKIIKNNPKQTTVYTYKTKGEEWSSGTKHPRTLQLSSEGAIRAVKYFTETFKLWESEYSVLCHSLWLALWPFAALTPPPLLLPVHLAHKGDSLLVRNPSSPLVTWALTSRLSAHSSRRRDACTQGCSYVTHPCFQCWTMTAKDGRTKEVSEWRDDFYKTREEENNEDG